MGRVGDMSHPFTANVLGKWIYLREVSNVKYTTGCSVPICGGTSTHIKPKSSKVKNVNNVGKFPTVSAAFKRGFAYAYGYAVWVYNVISFN